MKNIALVLLLSGAVAGCTEAHLRGIPVDPTVRDDKLRIEGSFCTEDPTTLLFPVRVLIMVDCSESMIGTDPPDPATGETQRQVAVREVVDTLLNEELGGVSIAVIRFSAEAQVLTFADHNGNGVQDAEEGFFTTSRSQLIGPDGRGGVLPVLGETDRTSDFLNALGVAYVTLRDEMDSTEEASLPLSRYIILFVSDFLPDVEGEEARENSTERVVEAVEDLNDLARLFRVGQLEAHFAYISTARADVDRRATDLARTMAVHGNGSFRSFPNNEELNFLFVDLSALRRVFTLRTMVAVNTSTVPRGVAACGDAVDRHTVTCPLDFSDTEAALCCPDGVTGNANWTLEQRRECCDRDLDGFESTWCGGGDCDDWDNTVFPGATRFYVDSDSDGVSDEDEFRIMSDPLNVDTDGDGFSDLLEFRFRTSGLDPLDSLDADCPAGEVALGDTQCSDGQDNDGDGDSSLPVDDPARMVDATDPGCMSPFDDDETDGTVVASCVDGIDNDDDGWQDAEDPDCQLGVPEDERLDTECNDGVDNDGDGFIDVDDEGCSSAHDDLERGVAHPHCRDGVDNDLDGWVDFADQDCIEQLQLEDTDGDGLYDCEERFFGTSRSGADTDADGIPDPVEIRFDTSAVNDDLLDDYDRDHTVNGDEVRLGTDPRFNDAGGRARSSYRYQVGELGLTRTAAEIGGYSRSACNDGRDNDRDGFVDAEDEDCLSPLQQTEEPITEPTCLDGLDNDEDGWVDMEDARCLEDLPEISVGQTLCNDGEDNDLDGLVDAEDLDCMSGLQATEEPIDEVTCLDGEDNDGDGWTDFDDPDCALGRREATRGDTACSNGIDDDGDLLADSDDPDCMSGFQATEEPITDPMCHDGRDNDLDGWVDMDDPSCLAGRPEFATQYECNDGLDNDGDGLADTDDPDCGVAVAGNEARVAERTCTDGEDNDEDGWFDEEDAECLSPGSRSCYEFDIQNITLAQTIGNGWNQILIFAGEVPFDDPEAYARFMVACVLARFVCSEDPELAEAGECDANFKEPPAGRFRVSPEHFVPLDEFDPRYHCIDPSEGF